MSDTQAPITFTAEEVAALRAGDRARIEELEAMIDNAAMAAAETSPSWKHRCYSIMGELGLDYGDPDWLMPGERRKLDAALARISDLENLVAEQAMPIEEIERLLDAEQDLERHFVAYDGLLHPDVWVACTRGSKEHRTRELSRHPTRWLAIEAARIADISAAEPAAVT